MVELDADAVAEDQRRRIDDADGLIDPGDHLVVHARAGRAKTQPVLLARGSRQAPGLDDFGKRIGRRECGGRIGKHCPVIGLDLVEARHLPSNRRHRAGGDEDRKNAVWSRYRRCAGPAAPIRSPPVDTAPPLRRRKTPGASGLRWRSPPRGRSRTGRASCAILRRARRSARSALLRRTARSNRWPPAPPPTGATAGNTNARASRGRHDRTRVWPVPRRGESAASSRRSPRG